MRFRTLLSTTLALLWILTAFIEVPMVQTSPQTYGPRLDELHGYIVESPAAQWFELSTGGVDIWFDIREPELYRILEDEGFTMMNVSESFQFYYIAFNMRDQLNPSGGGGRWRTSIGGNDALYYTYSGAEYENYVPLDDQAFRNACAHLVPKAVIEAVAYGGVAGSAINSTVPPALGCWHNPYVYGNDYSVSVAISILEGAGYVWEPLAPNPAPDPWGSAPSGNWLDPHTALAADNPGTPWDDRLGSPMNHITFAGVTTTIAPRSWLRDDLCAREWRNIGLPIEHEEVAFSTLTDVMMDYHQFDMYALGWKIGRSPDYLYGFFHSSHDMIEGYNTVGIHDSALDTLLEIIQHETDPAIVQTACFDAQDMIAEKLPYIVTVTRPGIAASAKVGAPGHWDTLRGVVNSPGYTQENDWTYYQMRWLGAETAGNPYGIGGDVYYLVGSVPTNYHPGYASTTDEWNVIGRLFDGLINVDPYTGHDIPWLAEDWAVQAWTDPYTGTGMNTTFWLRGDVYFHDGEKFNATMAKWSLEFARDQQIARAFPMWQNLTDIVVHDEYTFSVYHNATSLWTFYHIAGPDIWQVNDAACWATMFPKHCYEGTGPTFRPEATVNPINPELTCLIGTGPFIYRDLGMPILGQAAHLVAYRSAADPTMGITTHWFMSVADIDALIAEMFHWVGDVGGEAIPNTTPTQYYPPDGEVQIYDLTRGGLSYGLWYWQAGYDADADIAPEYTYHTPDGIVEGRDMAELGKHWSDCRDYWWPP